MKMKRLAIVLCLLALLCLGTLVACDGETTDCAHSAKEWVEEVSASCTVDGTVGHYVCNDCQKTLDANGAVLTNLSIPAAHKPASEWSVADGKHYHACASCDAKLDEAACAGGTATCTERATCATCGNAYGAEPAHAPASEWSVADGKHYHACANCDVKLDEAACAGGTATCTARATCTVCQNAYGPEPSHDPADEWSTENNKHYHACANCDAHLDETDCGGGRASCTERAECSVCGKVYGPEPSHAPASTWSYADGKHYHACANCSTHLDETPCAGGTATCTERATCATCGNAYGSEPSHAPASEWTTENGKHYHACANCPAHLDETPCAGGTATCRKLAECATCGEEYGEFAEHNHTIEKYDDDYHWMECECGDKGTQTPHRYTTSEVTEPTCTEGGYTTYSCACGHSYMDDETAPTGHKYADTWTSLNGYHWHAATCGCEGEKKDYARHETEAHVTEPTCTAQGYTVYTCYCGYESDPTDIVPANGHTPEGEWVETSAVLFDATKCEYTVHFRVECSACDGHDTKTEQVQRHSLYEKTVSAATCQAAGQKSQFCSSEDCVYHAVAYDTYSYTDAEAHVWEEVAGRSNDTLTVYKCHYCDATKTQSNGNSANISGGDLGDTSEIELGGNEGGNIVIGIDGGIKENLGGKDISISAGALNDDEKQEAMNSTSLSPEQQQMLEGCDIFDFTITATDFDGSLGGFATIRIPYTLQNGDDPNSIIVWYIDNGTLTPVEAVYAVDANGNGYVTFKTDHFSYYTVDTIDPAEICKQLGKHDETHVHVVAPTCTTGGYTLCLRCGEQIEGSATPALGHTISAEVVHEATCSESGLMRYTCSDCGLSYEVTVSTIGHYHVKVAQVTASCKTVGSETYRCAHCDDTYTVTFPKLAHNYHEYTVAPTCSTNGYIEKTCTACGDVVRMGITPATGHTSSAVWYSDKVNHYHVCIDCGQKMDEAEHVPGPAATEQTAQICTVCDYTIAPPVQHVHVLTVVEGVAPTCTEGGHITYYVCACGAWFADDAAQMRIEDHTSVILDAMGHKAQATPYVEPTCEQNGYTAGVWCDECQTYLRGHVAIAAYGHDYHTIVTAPTCTEKGSIVYRCSHCEQEDEAAAETIEALGHALRAIVTAPTCTEEGYTTYVCTRCTHSEKGDVTAALGHRFVTAFASNEDGHWHTCVRCPETTTVEAHVPDYPEATTDHGVKCAKCNYVIAEAIAHTHAVSTSMPEQAPTCTASGHMAYYICSCGQWFADEACTTEIYNRESVLLPALGHDARYVRAQSATCTENGYTAGIYCDSCQTWLSGHEEIASSGHSFISTYDQKLHWNECTACGERMDEALHNPVIMGTVAPTCEEYGHTEFACECGHTWEGDRVRPLGHDFGSWKENGDGTHTRVCSRDHAHTETDDCHYRFETVRSTCEQEGYTEYTCFECGHSYRDNITPAHGHAYGAWQFMSNGQHQRFCQYDGTHVEIESCVMISEVVEPTCTRRGYTTHTCEGCGHSETSDVVSALGHNFGEWTFIGDGQHKRTCQNDASHTETDWCVSVSETVPATCESDGYTKHTCQGCGETHTSDIVLALGHAYGEWTYCGDGQHKRVCAHDVSHEQTRSCITMTELVPSTCEEDGYTKHTCIDCGNVEKTDIRPASGHVYGPWSYDGKGGHERVCLRDCAHVEYESCKPSAEFIEPTCKESGYTRYTCDVCGNTYIADEIPPMDHIFDANGVCVNCGHTEGMIDEGYRQELVKKAKQCMTVLRRIVKLDSTDTSELSSLQAGLMNALTASELDQTWEAFGAKLAAVLEASDDALATTRFEVLLTITMAWDELKAEGIAVAGHTKQFTELSNQILQGEDEKTIRAVVDQYTALEEEVRQANVVLDARRKEVLAQMEARWSAFVESHGFTDAQLSEYENYVTNVEKTGTLAGLENHYNNFSGWMGTLESVGEGVDQEYLAGVLGEMNARWQSYTEKNDGTEHQLTFDEFYNYVQCATSNEVIEELYAQFNEWMTALEQGDVLDESYRQEMIERMNVRLDEAVKNGLTIEKIDRTYLDSLIKSAYEAQTKSELESLWSKLDQKLTELEQLAGDPEWNAAHTKAKNEALAIYRALTQAFTLTAEQKSEANSLRNAVTAASNLDDLKMTLEALHAFADQMLAEADELTRNRYRLATYMLNRMNQVTELGYPVNELNSRLSLVKHAMSDEELFAIYDEFELFVETLTNGELISAITKQNVIDEMTNAWNTLLGEYPASDEQMLEAERLMNEAREASNIDVLYAAQNGLSNLIAEIRRQNGAVDEVLRADTMKNMYSRWYSLTKQFNVSDADQMQYDSYYQAVKDAKSNDEIYEIYGKFKDWVNILEESLREDDPNLDENRQKEILEKMSNRYYDYSNRYGYDGEVQATYYEWLTGVQYAKTDAEVDEYYKGFCEWMDSLEQEAPSLDENERMRYVEEMKSRWEKYTVSFAPTADQQMEYENRLNQVYSANSYDELNWILQEFHMWIDKLESGASPDVPTIDESRREAFLKEMSVRWRAYEASGLMTDEQQQKYSDWRYRAKTVQSNNELDWIIQEFNTWMDKLESGENPDAPVVDYIQIEVGSLAAQVGDDIEGFLKENLIGKPVILYFTDGSKQVIPITRDMIIVYTDEVIFTNVSEYCFDIAVRYENEEHIRSVTVSVSPNMDNATVVGEYVVDPSLHGYMDEWKTVLYDNGYAHMMINGETLDMAAYRIENGLLYVSAEGAEFIFAINEEAKQITTYVPAETVLGTYYYYDTMFTVYGDYHGPDHYVCVITMMESEGKSYALTTTAWLDCEKCMLSCAMFGGDLYFDEAGNLSEKKPGEDVGCEHLWQNEYREPTCMEDGYGREYCVLCGMVSNEWLIPRLNHLLGADGCCTMCGTYIGGGEVGCNHLYEVEMRDPTCMESGYGREYCIHCGITNKSWTIAPLPHEIGADGCCMMCGMYVGGGDSWIDESLRQSYLDDMNFRWDRLCQYMEYSAIQSNVTLYESYYYNVSDAKTQDELVANYAKFEQWITRLETKYGVNVPAIDETQRKYCLEEMMLRWNEYSMNYQPTYEQQMEYENWCYMVECAGSNDELDSLMRDFNTWIKELAANIQPPIYVNDYYVDLDSLTATVGEDVEVFLKKYVLGRNVYLHLSDGSKQSYPITRDMVSVEADGFFSAEGRYALSITIWYEGASYGYQTTISVLPDMSDSKVVGDYAIDPMLVGGEGEWRIALYENGYAMMQADGQPMSVMTYRLENGVLYLSSDGMEMIFAIDEEKGALVTYVPAEAPIGTYYYYDTMFTVYGDYHGPDNYVCVITMMGEEGVSTALTMSVWLDCEQGILSCPMFGRDMYFDESGNLSEYKPGECQHVFTSEYAEATCMAPGYHKEYCIHCGMVIADEVVPPLPHGIDENGYCHSCGGYFGSGEQTDVVMYAYLSNQYVEIDASWGYTMEDVIKQYLIDSSIVLEYSMSGRHEHAITWDMLSYTNDVLNRNGDYFVEIHLNLENYGTSFSFHIWVYGGAEDNEDAEMLRKELLEQMQMEWNWLIDEMQGNIAPHFASEYENIWNRMACESDPKMMHRIFDEEFQWLKEEVRLSQGPQDYVCDVYPEQRSFELEGGHPYDMKTFIEKFVIGTNLNIFYSQSGLVTVPIDWSMIQFDPDMDISGCGQYEFYLVYNTDMFGTHQTMTLTVLMDMSTTKLLGSYACDFSCIDEDTVFLEIYDNGYAYASFGDGEWKELCPCWIEGDQIFWDTGDGVYVLLIVDEKTAEVYDLAKAELPVIGTYNFDGECTLTVYGDYTGYGRYVARFSMWEDGLEYWLNLAVDLDLENRTLYCEMLGHEPLSFDDEGNLFYVENGGENNDYEDVVMPNAPTVDDEDYENIVVTPSVPEVDTNEGYGEIVVTPGYSTVDGAYSYETVVSENGMTAVVVKP